MKSTPSMQDIARAAGVVKATVSLALRNHPRISPETRRRVQAMAKKMGYRPNATVAQLLAQVRASKTAKYQATLGLINASENPNSLQEIQTFRDWVNGSVLRAEQLGYAVDKFWLYEKDISPTRLADIISARGIHGLVVAACLSNGTLPAQYDALWSCFACVVLGIRTTNPALHVACNDQFSTARQSVEQALRLGYQRPALVMNGNIDDLVEGRFSAGFWAGQRKLPERVRVPEFRFASRLDVPLHFKISTSSVLEQFKTWMARHRPDVIVCIHPEVKEWIHAVTDLKVPRDIGMIHLDWTEEFKGWAGMKQNNLLIGSAGIDLVVGQLHRNELGVPTNPKCILIESTWTPGDTVLARPGAAEAASAR